MTASEVVQSYQDCIEEFEELSRCRLRAKDNNELLEDFSKYLEFLGSLNIFDDMELVIRSGIEYSVIRSNVYKKLGTYKPILKQGSGVWTRKTQRKKKKDEEGDSREFINVNIGNIKDNPDWEFEEDVLPASVIDEQKIAHRLFDSSVSTLVVNFPRDVKLLKKIIRSPMPEFIIMDPLGDLGLIKYRWWDEVQYQKHKLAKEFCKSNPLGTGNSNSHKLHKSAKWMNPLIKELIKCENESEMIELFKSISPSFNKPRPNAILYYTVAQRINNKGVAECLASLHNEKHDDEVSFDAILKKYPSELSLNKK